MDNLPQYTTVVSVRNTEDCKNKASSSKEATSEGKSAQMTIFYDGKVWVFDSLPTEKAQELMVLASKGNKNNSTTTGNVSTTSNAEKINLIGAGASTSSPTVNLLVSKSGKEKVQVQSDANNSDLPIARRSSLHRFLEKRKERSTARAPYQVGHDAPGSSSKEDDQLELKL
ncbi:hypothetical protein Leryth_010203 [Lithospermum erythrorhizon]|nr:hypothetical protein Leryth_010203 [Lithospermum erythrorhizon]